MIRVLSGVLVNGEPQLVEVQVAVYRRAFPQVVITGLPSVGIRETRDRLLAIFREMKIVLPRGKYVIHLHPADVKKTGSFLDIALWLGLYLSTMRDHVGKTYAAVGELSLDGHVELLQESEKIINYLKSNSQYKYLFVAKNQNGSNDTDRILGIDTVSDIVDVITQKVPPSKFYRSAQSALNNQPELDLPSDDLLISDQLSLALQLSCVGGHSGMILGSPGEGKTYIERILPYFLAPLLIAKVQNRLMKNKMNVVDKRDHTNTPNELKQGILDLSSPAILYDEFPRWNKKSREILLPFLEIGYDLGRDPKLSWITGNPCPCGYYGETACKCTDYDIQRYQKKLSGPFLDRVALSMRLRKDDYRFVVKSELQNIQKCIRTARNRQEERGNRRNLPKWSVFYSWTQATQGVNIPKSLENIWKQWSLRRKLHVLQVAWTLADLKDKKVPEESIIFSAAGLAQPMDVGSPY